MRNTLISKNTKPINHFESLDKLKILTFWNIIKHKNILLLDVDYDENKKYKSSQVEEINNTWLRLYDEYYVLLDDSKSRFKMGKSFDELKQRDKIGQVKNNYDFLVTLKKYVGIIPNEDISKYEQETYRNVVKIDKRIKPLFFEGIDTNISNLDKVLKSLINRYNADNKKNEQEVNKQIQNVYDVVASAESWLERSIPIDDMVVSHWVAIEKQINNKQKAQQKNGK